MSTITDTQHGNPVLCMNDGGAEYPLQRIELEKSSDSCYDENWLQELIHRNPALLPVKEIDPIFGELIPLCTELQTPVGFLDNLFINPLGMLTLVECKLWRNPEARRKVVGQILDYAQALSRWSYDDLLRHVQRSLKTTSSALFETVKGRSPDLKEKEFIDNVSKNLKRGRFLLLVVGDGIRESLENISDYLQEHAQLNFTFALVEEALFRLPDELGGHILAQPRVLVKTVEIERAIVRIEGNSVVIDGPRKKDEGPPNVPGRKGSVTEQVFFEELGKISDTLPGRVQALFDKALERGLILEPGAQGIAIKSQDRFNFGQLNKDGYLRNYGCGSDLGKKYLSDLAAIFDDAEVVYSGTDGFYSTVRKKDGSYVSLHELLSKEDGWLALVQKVLAQSEA